MAESVKKRSEIEEQDTWKLEDMIESPEKFEELMDGVEERIQDASVMGGSIGEMHAEKIEKLYSMAMKMGAPIVGLVDCAGFRLQESMDALDGFGKLRGIPEELSDI